MADDKRGREKQAKREDRRQREREIAADRARGEEDEPPEDTADDDDREGGDAADGIQRGEGAYPDPPHECHRRGCDERASFVVVERYREETGQGTVEAEAHLCRAHTREESPSNLDSAGEDYVFRIEPITDATAA